MQSYATLKGYIPDYHMATFKAMSQVIEVLPNMVFDPEERGWGKCKNQITCHMLCRGLAAHFPMSV